MGCSKPVVVFNANAQPSPGDVEVMVALQPEQPGIQVPVDFTGLSFESSALTDSTYFNTNNASFINFIKTLGTGLIRIGGNSTDKTHWTNRSRTPTTGNDSISTSDIDRFFDFTGQTGWKVMFGLNLGSGTASAAKSEAQYVYKIAGNQLLYFEIGNEPDVYATNGLRNSSYSYADFENEFVNYYQVIKSGVPDAQFSGPTAAYNTTKYVLPFAADEYSKIGLLTEHYYWNGPPSDTSVTITNLLNGDPTLPVMAGKLNIAAQAHHLGYRISECNSVYGGGKAGVSNSLASALWGLDFMFILAGQGDGGVNFHGGGDGEYTPISTWRGQFRAMPLYYGLLMFKMASAGRLIPVNLGENIPNNLDTYAVLSDNGDVLVTLINKDPSQELFAKLNAGRPIVAANILRLSGSSLDAQSGITIGGDSVNSEGNWSSPHADEAALSGNYCTLKIEAGSAVLVTIK